MNKLVGTESRRLELYNNGLNDREIAEEIGVSSPSICSWRKRRKLTRNVEPGEWSILDVKLEPTFDTGYFCGLVIGDGWVHYDKNSNNYTIALESTKQEIVGVFYDAASDLGLNPYRTKPREKTRTFPNGSRRTDKMYCVIANSKEVYEALKPCKLKDSRWETPEFLTSKKSRWGFVEGYFDAEGCISSDRRCSNNIHSLAFTSKHETNLVRLRELINEFGIDGDIYPKNEGYNLQIHKREHIERFINKSEKSFKIKNCSHCSSVKEEEDE